MNDIREQIVAMRKHVASYKQLSRHRMACLAMCDTMERMLAEQQRLEGALGLSMAREVRQSAVVEAARGLARTNSGRLVCGWDELCQSFAALDHSE